MINRNAHDLLYNHDHIKRREEFFLNKSKYFFLCFSTKRFSFSLLNTLKQRRIYIIQTTRKSARGYGWSWTRPGSDRKPKINLFSFFRYKSEYHWDIDTSRNFGRDILKEKIDLRRILTDPDPTYFKIQIQTFPVPQRSVTQDKL